MGFLLMKKLPGSVLAGAASSWGRAPCSLWVPILPPALLMGHSATGRRGNVKPQECGCTGSSELIGKPVN